MVSNVEMCRGKPKQATRATPGHHLSPQWSCAGALILLTLLMAGCSSTQFAYHQLDWVIIWWVDDYVPLTDTQEERLQQQVDQHLAWHCSTELPRYNAWLARVKSEATHPPITTAQVTHLQDEVLNAFTRVLVEITPTATQLLGDISADQIQSLKQAMAKSQQEKKEELLGETTQEQLARREERTLERAQNWLGDLTDEQRTRIAQWNKARGDQTKLWLEGRQHWQTALLKTLEKQDSPEFKTRITHLLQSSSDVRGERYQNMLIDSRIAMTALITDLINTSTPAQRDHLSKKIDALQEDFQALTCQ